MGRTLKIPISNRMMDSPFNSLLRQVAEGAPEAATERKALLASAKELVLALERPDDVIERVCVQLLETSTIKIAVELGIFKLLNDEATPAPSAASIARDTNSDPVLIDVKYQNPTDPKVTALGKANKVTGVTPMDIFFGSPHLNAFVLYMGTFTMGHKQWTEVFPVEAKMIQRLQAGEDSVTMVDVGGGFGHQANLLKDTFPTLPGKLVVQDLPQMKGEDLPGIEFQAHDFFLEQPIKAMEPSYSRLLVNEWVIPERGASRFMTIEDMNMMALSGMERTERQHGELLEAAGLKISNIFYANDSFSKSVIEAVVA
ncbi:putative Sterigmatocystin 8-O-methyltransferase [Glarea lozoyensis 74030]|uniref:Putative Sterigmatocystin 8-O-methyltransferase n=1 Tax=Glarea lozoyensis (strain ATCC 74030 / MF5533) TaxID=1104152 RepID=H0EZJ0_GLAL7|nr:putative Sterigmatocystin 8-O-methyltransferase [Glarea lozoyensis 74030]